MTPLVGPEGASSLTELFARGSQLERVDGVRNHD